MEEDPFPRRELVIGESGRAVLLSGSIGKGTHARLVEILDSNPDVRLVKLQSFGGRVNESLRIAGRVSLRGLNT